MGAVQKLEILNRRGKLRLTPTSNLSATGYPNGGDGDPTINRIPMTSRVPRHLIRDGLRRNFGNPYLSEEPIHPC